MPTDFRSERMESPEGRGNARRAWEAYVKVTNRIAGPVLRPLITPAARRMSGPVAADLLGFWVVWHLEGGFEGLLEMGFSRSGLYRRIRRFREVTGMHPDEFTMPGVTFDLAAYQEDKARSSTEIPESGTSVTD